MEQLQARRRTTSPASGMIEPRPGRTEAMKIKPTAIGDVYVLVRRGDLLLLPLREGTGYKDGEWGPPAGKVEVGETYRGAAVRELREETGRDADPAVMRFVHLLHRHPAHVEAWPWVGAFFDASDVRGDPVNREPTQVGRWAGIRFMRFRAHGRRRRAGAQGRRRGRGVLRVAIERRGVTAHISRCRSCFARSTGDITPLDGRHHAGGLGRHPVAGPSSQIPAASQLAPPAASDPQRSRSAARRRCALRVPPELADPASSLEVGEHEYVQQLGAAKAAPSASRRSVVVARADRAS